MTIKRNSSTINETFIVEDLRSLSGSCPAVYTDLIEPCATDNVVVNGGIVSNYGITGETISATMFYGNGSGLTNIDLAHSATTGILGNGEYHLSDTEYSKISGNTLDTMLINTYVPYTGANKDIDLGYFNLTGNTGSFYNLITTNPNNGLIQAQFGVDKPFYITANWPTLGFNSYWDGGWRYGAGSDGHYGGFQSIDPNSGQMDYYLSVNPGNEGDLFDINRVFTLYPNGTIEIPYFTEFGVLTVDSSGLIGSDINIIPNFNIHTGDTSIHFTKESLNPLFVNISGDTMTGQLNSPVISATTISATTIYGNLIGDHNTFTTGVTLINDVLYFDRTDLLSAYTVNLSPLDNNAQISGITSSFNTHTGDTSVHFALSAITLTNIGSSAHTHVISGVTGLESALDSKVDLSGGTLSGTLYGTTMSANTISATTFYGDGSHLSGLITANDYTTGATLINDVLYFDRTDLLSAYTVNLSPLDNNAQVSGITSSFNTHTGDTSIHFKLSGITLSNIGSSAHTHPISEINNLQTSLNSKTDLTLFNTHTGDTSVHFALSAITLTNIGSSAHTHVISGVTGLESALDSKVDLSGGTMTGNLFTPILSANTLNVSSNIISNTGDVIVNDNLKITGDLVVLGSTITANTQTILIKDNLVTLNYGETGSTVTKGVAGVEIDRGSGLKYVFYFDESSNSFRIGTTGNTQPVATREDSPINNGIAVWDNSLYRFKSTLNLSANTISATTLYGNGSNLTNINLAHSATTGILGNGQYHLSQSEYTQISGSVLNNTYVSLSGDVMNGQLTVPSISATTITGTTLYGNGSNLTGINDYYVTGGTLNSGLLTLNRQNGSLTIPGFLGGTGTTNYITKWNSTTGLTNSSIFDNGNIGINTLNPTQLLDVNGGIKGNNITISGNTILNSVTGNTFYGNGSGLTNINLAHSATTGILGNGQYHLSDTEYAQISGSVLNNTYVSLSGDVMSGDLRLNNIIVNSLSGTAINDIKVSSNGKIILSDDKQTINNITGSTILDNFPSLTGDACVWDYVLKSNTGMRAGTITGVWSGSTVDFYETSTNDIGSTSSVNLSVDYLNSNIRLLINVVSGTWLVKIKRTIL